MRRSFVSNEEDCLVRLHGVFTSRGIFYPPSIPTYFKTFLRPELGPWGYFQIFIEWKMTFIAFPIKWTWLGVGYLNRPSPEVDYFYTEYGLEVTFWTTINAEPQTPDAQLCLRPFHSDKPACLTGFVAQICQWSHFLPMLPLAMNVGMFCRGLKLVPLRKRGLNFSQPFSRAKM